MLKDKIKLRINHFFSFLKKNKLIVIGVLLFVTIVGISVYKSLARVGFNMNVVYNQNKPEDAWFLKLVDKKEKERINYTSYDNSISYFASGDGSEQNPFIINNARHFEILNDMLDNKYIYKPDNSVVTGQFAYSKGFNITSSFTGSSGRTVYVGTGSIIIDNTTGKGIKNIYLSFHSEMDDFNERDIPTIGSLKLNGEIIPDSAYSYNDETRTLLIDFDCNLEANSKYEITFEVTSYYEKSSFEVDTYRIVTPDISIYYRQSDYMTFDNLYYKVTDNIDLSGVKLKPIGDENVAFKGNIDFDYHRIKGLNLEVGKYNGLFGLVNDATIKNVILDGNEVEINNNELNYSGLLVGAAQGNSKIYNIGVLDSTLNITRDSSNEMYAGSIVGHITGSTVVANSYSYAKIKSSGTSNSNLVVGGLVGYRTGTNTKFDDNNPKVYLLTMYGEFDIKSSKSYQYVYNGNMFDASESPTYCYYLWQGDTIDTNTGIDNTYAILKSYDDIIADGFKAHLNNYRYMVDYYVGNSSTIRQNQDEGYSDIAFWYTNNDESLYPIIKKKTDNSSNVNLNDVSTTPIENSIKVNLVNPSNNYETLTYYVKITDKNESINDYTNKKIVLPFNSKTANFKYAGTGKKDNYTMTLSGWELTSVVQNGNRKTSKINGSEIDYNYVLREGEKAAQKDLGTVYAEGGFYLVPDGVTEITLNARFAYTIYAKDAYNDLVFNKTYTNGNSSAYGATGSSNSNDGLTENTAVSTLSAVYDRIGQINQSDRQTIYDVVVMLCGNFHYNPSTSVNAGSTATTSNWAYNSNDRPFTIMSMDKDGDLEPDYSFYTRNVHDENIPSLRFNFVNVLGIPQVGTINAKLNALTILSGGSFEVTETAKTDRIDIRHFQASYLKLNGGYYDVYSVWVTEAKPLTKQYIYFGGYAKAIYFSAGNESRGVISSLQNDLPVFVVAGGRIETLASTYFSTVINASNDVRFYVDGGYINDFYTTYNASLMKSAKVYVNNSYINRYYAGGHTESAYVYGGVETNIKNSRIGQLYGGPEYGTIKKGSTLNIDNCNIDNFYGSGYGGTQTTEIKLAYVDSGSDVCGSNDYYYNISNNCSHENTSYGSDTNKSYCFGRSSDEYGIETAFYSTTYSKAGCASKAFAVYYSSLSAANVDKVTVNITNSTILKDFYGGGNKGIVDNSIVVNMDNTTVKGNLYGGGRSNAKETLEVYEDTTGYEPPTFISYTIDTEAVYPQKYTYTWSGDKTKFNNSSVNTTEKLIYSENDGKLGNVNGNIYLNIKNSTIENNVYGGGNLSEVIGNIYINLSDNNTIKGDVYGGGNEAEVTGNIDLRIKKQPLENVYGGGKLGDVEGTSTITVSDSNIENVYGGGNEASVTNTKLYLEKGAITNVYGGSNKNGTVSNSEVYAGYKNEVNAETKPAEEEIETPSTPTEPTVPYLPDLDTCKKRDITYGYSYVDNMFNFEVTNNTDYDFTSWSVVIKFANVTAESTNNWSGHKNTWNTTEELTITHWGQWYKPNTTTLPKNSTTKLFDNNYPLEIDGTDVEVTSVVITAYDESGNEYTNTICKDEDNKNPENPDPEVPDYGEEENPVEEVIFANVVNIYGGNNQGGLCENTKVYVKDAEVTNVYGGGDLATTTNTYVKLEKGSTVLENVYGGGNEATVTENTFVILDKTYIKKSAYAGGNGTKATVEGNTEIITAGDTLIEHNLFGGGNAAETGLNSKNTSIAKVSITGGTIKNNVYGGANTSKIFGYTKLEIGPKIEGYDSSAIHIYGTVFGGGEANAAGSEDYDYSYISVTKGIDLNIDAQDTNITIDGSIFGSGNASSTSGYSNIKIYNFGERKLPKNLISIQRASDLLLYNSSLNLSGATDRTNQFNSIVYSLSRIDSLTLANDSTLYIQNGTNVVKEFNSVLINDTEKKLATVKIQNGEITKNVDNRLYMVVNKAFNIIDSENLSTGTFGSVNGMSFLGLFENDREKIPSTGIYNSNYNTGDAVSTEEIFQFYSGSYVMGLHKNNHDIEKDGFYTNYVDDSNTIEVKYIEPTPDDAKYYRWDVGTAAHTYEISLTASKFATMGTAELPLLGFEKPNTYFDLISYNDNSLESDVKLINPDNIPRITKKNADALTTFGLEMSSSNANWLTDGTTYFVSDEESSKIMGTKTYITNNTNEIPTLNFIFAHSKNISEDKKLGSVTIGLLSYTPIDEVTYEIQRIYINVYLDTKYYENDNYESSMTPGKEYELFVNSKTDITSTSSLSAYFSLLVKKDKSIYTDAYHRVLISNFKLPENTRITMIDRTVETKPVYYYYDVDNSDKNTEYVSNKDGIETEFYIYPLADFVAMGSTSPGNNYDDVEANKKYFNAELGVSEEEFIFIVDYSEANITEDITNAELLLELKDEDECTHYDSLGVSHSNMVYNIYADANSSIEIEMSSDKETAYHGYDFNIEAILDFSEKVIDMVTIKDTNYIQDKMGLKLSLYNSNGEKINGTTLFGTVFTINGKKYYADIDGSIRANIADLVSDIKVNINVNLEKSVLPTDRYKIVLEAFGSPDGLYYGLTSSGMKSIEMDIVNENYGLNSTVDKNSVIVDKVTGLDKNNSNEITYNIEYSSQFNNPNIRVILYRRKYDTNYSLEYEAVDLKDYVLDELIKVNEKEYLVSNNINEINEFTIHLKDTLKSGTYRMTFELYNNDSYIDEVYSYLIIR